MPATVLLNRFAAVAATIVVPVLLVNAAIGFVVAGAALSVAAGVLWFQNRGTVNALHDFLAHQARTGTATVDRLHGNGA